MGILDRNNVHWIGDHGPVIVYAHGFGCNQTMWRRITPAFEGTHRQVLFDYVGSGNSDISAFDPARYSELAGYAQDLLEICDELGFTRGIRFIGHSVSSSIGLLASIERPGLFDKLALLGPSPCFLNDPPDYMGGFEHADLEGLLSLMDQNFIGWANYLAPVVSGEALESPVSKELTGSFCSTEPSTIKVFGKAAFFADIRADLAKVSRPCLILQHRNDVLAPLSVGQYLHDKLGNSTLQVLDVSGHSAHMTHPALVIKAMQEFFAQPNP